MKSCSFIRIVCMEPFTQFMPKIRKFRFHSQRLLHLQQMPLEMLSYLELGFISFYCVLHRCPGLLFIIMQVVNEFNMQLVEHFHFSS